MKRERSGPGRLRKSKLFSCESLHSGRVREIVERKPRDTIYVRFNVPRMFIVPPPIGREHVPRGSVPPSRLTGGWYPTEVATRRGEGEAYDARNRELEQ